MPRPTWPDPIYRAFFDAWIDECEMPDEMWDERVDAFVTRWGGLDADAFIHALHFGDESERLCALFALGYLAVPDVEALLEPFLYSPIRKECWASAIGLGESRNEQAFVLLLDLLSDLEVATGRVFRWSYYAGEQNGFEVEAPTLEAWFEGWLARELDLFSKPHYGIGIVRLQE